MATTSKSLLLAILFTYLSAFAAAAPQPGTLTTQIVPATATTPLGAGTLGGPGATPTHKVHKPKGTGKAHGTGMGPGPGMGGKAHGTGKAHAPGKAHGTGLPHGAGAGRAHGTGMPHGVGKPHGTGKINVVEPKESGKPTGKPTGKDPKGPAKVMPTPVPDALAQASKKHPKHPKTAGAN